MNFDSELKAIELFFKAAANLNSMRMSATPPDIVRPLVIWSIPSRGRKQHLGRYAYTQSVKQYGKLYFSSVDEALLVQQLLIESLENRLGTIEVLSSGGDFLGYIKSADFDFKEAQNLDVPFVLMYEASYNRARPEPAPPPLYVSTDVSGNSRNRKE